MKFHTLVLASAAVTSAFSQSKPIAKETPFNLITARTNSPIHNSIVQASLHSLFVNLPSQNATCDTPTNSATFIIDAKQELHLYSCATSSTPQTIFVDRSGMGMGKIGYVTGNETLGRYWETQGWALNNGHELAFKGTGLQACPKSIDGGWSLWLQGVATPGWNQNCTNVVVRAVRSKHPVACVYT